LIRTTRLAAAGEIAGRATHELLNPLTILLTRVGLMQKRLGESQKESLGLVDEIRTAWTKDYTEGGFPKLVKNWESESKVSPGKNLFQEDVQNFAHVSSELRDQGDNLSKDIDFIKVEAERIGKILNGMRRLGHFKSDLKIHSLHAILSDCRQIMLDLFEQKNCSVIHVFHADQDTCMVDRDEVIQSVTNLMRNSLQALTAARRGEGDRSYIKISTRNEAGQILVDIEDNGVGIERQDQEKLFHGSFTTKPRDEGTGLGLGISRRFVRNFGGDLEFVKSTPLESTVFRLRIPLHAEKTKYGAVA
jgi:two-component system, NtrC family, sensor kinase